MCLSCHHIHLRISTKTKFPSCASLQQELVDAVVHEEQEVVSLVKAKQGHAEVPDLRVLLDGQDPLSYGSRGSSGEIGETYAPQNNHAYSKQHSLHYTIITLSDQHRKTNVWDRCV